MFSFVFPPRTCRIFGRSGEGGLPWLFSKTTSFSATLSRSSREFSADKSQIEHMEASVCRLRLTGEIFRKNFLVGGVELRPTPPRRTRQASNHSAYRPPLCFQKFWARGRGFFETNASLAPRPSGFRQKFCRLGQPTFRCIIYIDRAGSAEAEIVRAGARTTSSHRNGRPSPSQARSLRNSGRTGRGPARHRDSQPLEVRSVFVSEILPAGHRLDRAQ